MIIDCCIFLDELDLLEARLEYLNDHVDYFVVVESNHTFNGDEKPFHIKANMDRFEKYGDRFIYIPHEVFITGLDFSNPEERNQLRLQRMQRNALTQPLDQFDPEDDIVIFGDIDEIPNRNVIEEAANIIRNGERIVALDQDLFESNFDQINSSKHIGTLMSSVYQVRGFTPQLFRGFVNTYLRVPNGGWHLMNWGKPSKIESGEDWLNTDRNNLNQEMLAIFSQIEYKNN
jgi:beta-1,4-mannosyl-glycoprotein beta-1,4-N-acetylglucosaminyltransferase